MLNLCKKLASCAIDLGVSEDSVFSRLVQNRVAVFLYHDISNTPSEFSRRYSLNVTPELLEQQIGMIRDYFTVISPMQLLSGEYSTPAAMITIDDGLIGSFEDGLKVFERCNCPALYFVNMEPILGGVFWSGLVTYLVDTYPSFQQGMRDKYGDDPALFLKITLEDAALFLGDDRIDIEREVKLYHAGFAIEAHLRKTECVKSIYLGNHLFNHYNAATIDAEELKKQYILNRDALSHYSNTLNFFSYPFGQPRTCWNENTNRVIMECGADKAFSSSGGVGKRGGKWLMDRVPMDSSICSRSALKNLVVKGMIKNVLH